MTATLESTKRRRRPFDPAAFIAADCADGRDAPERIRLIEYDATFKRPHLVLTEPKNGGQHDYWFDWSKRTGSLYWRLAGFSSRCEQITLSRFSEPRPPKGIVWAAPDVELVMNGGRRLRTPAGYARLGYMRVEKPLWLPKWPGSVSRERTRDPFECRWAVAGDTVWCETCDDDIPDDDPCDHIWWCDEHGMSSTPTNRCGCPDPDA